MKFRKISRKSKWRISLTGNKPAEGLYLECSQIFFHWFLDVLITFSRFFFLLCEPVEPTFYLTLLRFCLFFSSVALVSSLLWNLSSSFCHVFSNPLFYLFSFVHLSLLFLHLQQNHFFRAHWPLTSDSSQCNGLCFCANNGNMITEQNNSTDNEEISESLLMLNFLFFPEPRSKFNIAEISFPNWLL